jgi:hypothetical protein
MFSRQFCCDCGNENVEGRKKEKKEKKERKKERKVVVLFLRSGGSEILMTLETGRKCPFAPSSFPAL